MSMAGREHQQRRKLTAGVNVTTIRCTVCMKKFGQREVVKYQGQFYHKECLDDLRHGRHNDYKGKKQKDRRPPIRGV